MEGRCHWCGIPTLNPAERQRNANNRFEIVRFCDVCNGGAKGMDSFMKGFGPSNKKVTNENDQIVKNFFKI